MTEGLTIVVPNRNRLSVTDNATKWLFKSLSWQTDKNFRVVVSDGNSGNINELEDFIDTFDFVSIISNDVGKEWNKPKLNNIAIRYINDGYIICTDADIVFSPDFIETVKKGLDEQHMIEARTLYWKENTANKVYNGEIDIESDFDRAKIGRIKYRSTCGGCQCLHIKGWEKVRGYDEDFVGWGSEDADLMNRAFRSGLKIQWIGETRDDILLIHQPHRKTREQVRIDLEHQEENKKRLVDVKRIVNENGWGIPPDNV